MLDVVSKRERESVKRTHFWKLLLLHEELTAATPVINVAHDGRLHISCHGRDVNEYKHAYLQRPGARLKEKLCHLGGTAGNDRLELLNQGRVVGRAH
jgi:hypothetical protein